MDLGFLKDTKETRDKLWKDIQHHQAIKKANRQQVWGEDLKLAGKYMEENGKFLGSDAYGNILTSIGKKTLDKVDKKLLYEDEKNS